MAGDPAAGRRENHRCCRARGDHRPWVEGPASGQHTASGAAKCPNLLGRCGPRETYRNRFAPQDRANLAAHTPRARPAATPAEPSEAREAIITVAATGTGINSRKWLPGLLKRSG